MAKTNHYWRSWLIYSLWLAELDIEWLTADELPQC